MGYTVENVFLIIKLIEFISFQLYLSRFDLIVYSFMSTSKLHLFQIINKCSSHIHTNMVHTLNMRYFSFVSSFIYQFSFKYRFMYFIEQLKITVCTFIIVVCILFKLDLNIVFSAVKFDRNDVWKIINFSFINVLVHNMIVCLFVCIQLFMISIKMYRVFGGDSFGSI